MNARILLPVVVLVALAGCGAPFDVRTPDEFVALDAKHRRSADYDYRATSADGVVLAVRVEENQDRGALAFWSQAVKNRLLRGGYAIVSEADVRAKSGETGHQYRCGRDENGRTYDYWVTVFRTDDRVLVIEAGGRRDRFEPVAARVEEAIASFEIH